MKREDFEKYKEELFEILKIKEHPKREILFNIAWKWGGDLFDVYEIANDLVELIKD